MRSVKWLIMNMMGRTCKKELITMLELEIILSQWENYKVEPSGVELDANINIVRWKNRRPSIKSVKPSFGYHLYFAWFGLFSSRFEQVWDKPIFRPWIWSRDGHMGHVDDRFS